MADPQASAVFVPLVDGTEIQLDLYDVDLPRWPTKAYIGAVPANLLADDQVTVITHDAAGNELASASLSTTDMAEAP